MNRLSILLSVLFLCALITAGCNVYEGLYEEGESDNPEVLLEDGRIALQQKRPGEAVQHLRKALEKAQDQPTLRKRIEIKLATAVLLEQQIDALSFTRIARKLSGDGGDAMIASKTQSQVCNFPAEHPRSAFDPREGVDLENIGSDAGIHALDEAQTLIRRVFSNDESFPCDDAALDQAIANLQSNDNISNEDIAEALVNYAIALTTEAYLDIVDAGGEATFFYATPPSGPDYIGTCFSSMQSCENTIARTDANLGHFDCATRIFQKRALLLGSTNAEELANLAREGYESLEVGVGSATCLTY